MGGMNTITKTKGPSWKKLPFQSFLFSYLLLLHFTIYFAWYNSLLLVRKSMLMQPIRHSGHRDRAKNLLGNRTMAQKQILHSGCVYQKCFKRKHQKGEESLNDPKALREVLDSKKEI